MKRREVKEDCEGEKEESVGKRESLDNSEGIRSEMNRDKTRGSYCWISFRRK